MCFLRSNYQHYAWPGPISRDGPFNYIYIKNSTAVMRKNSALYTCILFSFKKKFWIHPFMLALSFLERYIFCEASYNTVKKKLQGCKVSDDVQI